MSLYPINKEILKLYIEKIGGSGMTIIKHPLLNEILFDDLETPIDDNFKRFYNVKSNEVKTYGDLLLHRIRKQQNLYNDYFEDEDWDSIYALLHKSARLMWLEENKDEFTDEQAYYEFLKDAYVDAEFPMSGFDSYEDLLIMFYHFDNPQLMMDKEEKAYFDKLPNTIKIYRGLNIKEGEELDNENIGLSFSLDKEQAIWFAKRFNVQGNTPTLIEAEVDKENIMAIILNRGEEEVLVNPSYIRIDEITEL